MNTLTGIEAERVNQILKHAADRLQILAYLPLHWDDDLFAEINCQPVTAALEKQWVAEEALQEIFEMGSTDGGRELSAIKACGKASRSTCRQLQADRASLQKVMDRPETQSDDLVKFIKYLNELKTHINIRLTTTVEDEAANRTLLHELTEKERKMEESKEALQAKLNEVKEEKERVSFQLDQTLRKLQTELTDLSQNNAHELESVRKDMEDALDKASTDQESRMRQLQDQVETIERQIAETVERNRDEELRLRKEKNRGEKTLMDRIAQYDADMLARRKQLDELNANLKRESHEYSMLKEYFDRVDADLDMQAQEAQFKSDFLRRADRGRMALFTAAQTIQKIARGRIDRAIVAKMKSKGGKKGGKKGKK